MEEVNVDLQDVQTLLDALRAIQDVVVLKRGDVDVKALANRLADSLARVGVA